MCKWKEFKLEDISLIVDCEHKTAPVVDNSDFLSVRTSDISNGRIDFDKANRVSKETYVEWTKRLVPQEKDIILAREAPVGEVGWIGSDHKVCLGQRTVLIRPDTNKVEARYLLYYLVNKDAKFDLINQSTGSVVQHLNVKNIRNFTLNLRNSLPEQKAIAAILSSLDDKIDLLHRQNKTLEAMAETLFRQWFVEEAEDTWEIGCLGDFIEIFDSKRIPLSKMQRDKMKDGKLYPYYGAAQIMDHVNDYIFDGEFILLGEDGTVRTDDGYPVMQYATGKFWVNNHTHIFQAKAPYTNFFIWNYLIKKNIDEIVTGAVQPKINQTNLKSIDFPKFPETLVNKFNLRTESIFGKIKQNRSSIITLEKFGQLLLPKLMNGEIRVTP